MAGIASKILDSGNVRVLDDPCNDRKGTGGKSVVKGGWGLHGRWSIVNVTTGGNIEGF